MTKIAFIGAGSTVFTRNLIGDVLSLPELADTTTFALMDIDAERLRTSETVARGLVAAHRAGADVEATGDRRAALDGADYVVTSFQVGGYRPSTVVDFEVPRRFGLRQTIGDTLGVGGIMRGLRTIPVLLDVCRDMEEVCPDALLLQYVNPMAMLCWAVAERSSVRTVGLCHSVQHTAGELAADLGLPADELDYHVAGINHVAFFLRLERDGEDLYPALHRVIDEGRVPDSNRVRYEVMRQLGFFVTESSEHFAEYGPWFIKEGRDDLIDRFGIPLDEYPKRCIEQIARWKAEAERYKTANTVEIKDSHEYASEIMNSAWTGAPSVIYGNVRNNGLITSLPEGCAVEVPCLVDASGIQPTFIGDLPVQLTALIRTNINVQELTVAALMKESREHIYHAAMMDPHTAAELDLDQIWQLVDELLVAHDEWLPDWARVPNKIAAE